MDALSIDEDACRKTLRTLSSKNTKILQVQKAGASAAAEGNTENS